MSAAATELRARLPGVKPLLFPGSYTPRPLIPSASSAMSTESPGREATCVCGQSFQHPGRGGPLPKFGPCCRSVTAPTRAAMTAQGYSAAELVRRISAPGYAVVAFEGGVTLFVGAGSPFQAATLAEAMRLADGAPPSAQETVATRQPRGTNAARVYREKPCSKCRQPFLPTGPRSVFCQACK